MTDQRRSGPRAVGLSAVYATPEKSLQLWRLRDLLSQLATAKHWWAQFPDWDYSIGASGSASRPI